jgi:inorganic triphosphatase YgiF
LEAPETELKFAITEAGIAALCKHPVFAAPGGSDTLRSVYFDTPARDLRRKAFSLRVREVDGGFVQTLKRKGGASPVARREWETEVDSGLPQFAALARTPVSTLLGRDIDKLTPVFTTTVERSRRLSVDGSNVVEVSLDRGEITAGDRREPISELELELKSGDPKALFDLADDLARWTPLRLSFESKADRGYQLALGVAVTPLRTEAGCVPAEASAPDAFREVGWSCLGQVAVNVELLRRHRSIEALHQARVGLRRFRAGLTLFRPMAAGDGFTEIKADTKWLATELDAARNLDVFIQETLRPAKVAAEHRAGGGKLGSRLLAAQTHAYERALAAVDSARYAALLLNTARWLEIGDWTVSTDSAQTRSRGQCAAKFARPRLARLHRKILKRGPKLASLDAPHLHRLRINVKKLRYAAEFFAECFGDKSGKGRRRFLNALKHLQQQLGRLNDITVARHLAADLVPDQRSDAASAARLIVGRRQAGATRTKKAALRAFATLQSAKPFWR